MNQEQLYRKLADAAGHTEQALASASEAERAASTNRNQKTLEAAWRASYHANEVSYLVLEIQKLENPNYNASHIGRWVDNAARAAVRAWTALSRVNNPAAP